MGQQPGGRDHWRRREQVPINGQAVRKAREAKGWSREKLAAELGRSYRTVERYENGQRLPPREVAARLVTLLGMGEEVWGVVAARPAP